MIIEVNPFMLFSISANMKSWNVTTQYESMMYTLFELAFCEV